MNTTTEKKKTNRRQDLPRVTTRQEFEALPHGTVILWAGEPDRHPEGVVCRVNHHKEALNANHHMTTLDNVKGTTPKAKRKKVTKRHDYHHRDGRAFLKIKLKSMAEEQRIIKLEESRTPSLSRHRELYTHRMALRREIRATHAAYNVVRGRASMTSGEWNSMTRWERKLMAETANRLINKHKPDVKPSNLLSL